MNLNSLPDELIAGIFKYNSYETVNTIRKLNYRLNSIAKRYDYGTRIPVNKLRLSFRQKIRRKVNNGRKKIRRIQVYGEFKVQLSKEMWKYHKLGEYKNDGEVVFGSQKRSAHEDMEKLLSRIQAKGEAFIGFSGAALDDRVLQELTKQKNCLRSATYIQMCIEKNTVLDISKEGLAQFLAKCKKLRSFKFFVSTGIEHIANSEVFQGRKWTKIYLHRYGPGPTIDLVDTDKNFLHNVVKNCIEFGIDHFNQMKMRLTVSDFLDFFEECLLEENFFTKQEWRLPILIIGNLTVQNVCKRLEDLKEIDYFTMIDTNPQHLVKCDVHFRNVPVHITFAFEGRCGGTIQHDNYEDSEEDSDGN